MNQKETESIKKKLLSQQGALARFAGLGFKMIAIIGLGTYGGFLLDKTFPNKYSLFTVVLSLISVFVAMYSVIKEVTRNQEK